MVMVLIPAALFVLLLVNLAVIRGFRQRDSIVSWVALSAGWLVGGSIGVWSGFFFSYLADPCVRVYGAPVPAAFLVLELHDGQEQWVDYLMPAPALFAGSNVLMLALVGGAMIGGVMRLVVKTPCRVDLV